MKALLQIPFLPLLATLSLLQSSPAFSRPLLAPQSLLTQQPANRDTLSLSVALPELAEVRLKDGASRSGRVISIDHL